MQLKVEKNNGKFLNNHGIVEFKDVSKIKLNEKSEKVIVFYPNLKGKQQELELEFGDILKAHEFGEFIASKTALNRSLKTESKNNTLIKGLNFPWCHQCCRFFYCFGGYWVRSGWILKVLEEDKYRNGHYSNFERLYWSNGYNNYRTSVISSSNFYCLEKI